MVEYRQYQIGQRPNVETYFDSALDAEFIPEFGFQNICIATGAKWRADGVARQHVAPMPMDGSVPIYTPDDIMQGRRPQGRVVIFDDDHYYMGGVMAELLRSEGCEVTIITPSAYLSDWTLNTLEQHTIHRRLAGMGVNIVLNRGVGGISLGHVISNCVYTDAAQEHGCDAVVMVTSRREENGLYLDLKTREADWADAGIRSVKIIGDANAPGPIAWATYAGHRYARELDEPDRGDDLPFRREITELALD
ncbi:MAG: hypothetical protein QM706_12110 [Nitrospira sp.]